jgi:nucleotide-binding universal stress UspA family protein
MYKNILLPIDGSDLSRKAMSQAIDLAKSIGAKIVGFHVTPEYKFHYYAEYIPADFKRLEEIEERAKEVARDYLQEVSKACKSAGVACTTDQTSSDFPADAIVHAAAQHRCDLIAMATHGRSGVTRLMLGSETQKVIAHANVPVLVLR